MEAARATTAAEVAARAAYGRLVAWLSARSRDVAAAEDALAEAFAAALRTWPEAGVPDRPEAWLMTAAKRNLGRAARHAAVQAAAAPTLMLLQNAREPDMDDVPDERLKLMFVCAHPAIDAAARAPLMLQVVLGLDAAQIASAFLISPTAMGQRLVRAKTKIRDAGIAFELPGREVLPERLEAVLTAIYAAYGTGWEAADGADTRRRALTGEAIWLARLAVHLAPNEPEAKGLLALMLHCEARAGARRGADGAFIPLSQQDPALWSVPMIREAEAALSEAARLGRLGRYQLEAAIQSLHAQRGVTGVVPWTEMARLYEGLVRIAPTVGAEVGRAVAVAKAAGPAAGLELLSEVDAAVGAAYQPYWVARAALLEEMGARTEAADARRVAIGLTEDPSVRAYLLQQM